MSTREQALTLLDILSESDLKMFISLFGRAYNFSTENESDDLQERMDAFNSIIENRPAAPEGFNEKEELLKYLDERYGQ